LAAVESRSYVGDATPSRDFHVTRFNSLFFF
jgi:hypothetical protein